MQYPLLWMLDMTYEQYKQLRYKQPCANLPLPTLVLLVQQGNEREKMDQRTPPQPWMRGRRHHTL